MLEMGREAICTKRHFFVFNLSFKKSCQGCMTITRSQLQVFLKLTSWSQLEEVVFWQIQGYLKVTEGNFVLTDKKEEKNDHLKNSKNFKKIMKTS